ncbi:MAG: hypothetical protein ACI9MR_004010, partial [Myxococcota bacterium]
RRSTQESLAWLAWSDGSRKNAHMVGSASSYLG